MLIVFFDFQFYKVPVYEESSDRFLSENQLTEQLLLIIKDSGHNEAIGLLTTENRDTLAVAYEKLTEGKISTRNFIYVHFVLMEDFFYFSSSNRSSKQSVYRRHYKSIIRRVFRSRNSGF